MAQGIAVDQHDHGGFTRSYVENLQVAHESLRILAPGTVTQAAAAWRSVRTA
jgi:hypothetical protein